MATMLCKEMGIPLVVAKAKDKLQGAILQRVGADRIVYPEIEMGSRVAKSLVSKEFVDWISLSNDYSMVEIVVPQKLGRKESCRSRSQRASGNQCRRYYQERKDRSRDQSAGAASGKRNIDRDRF